MKIAAGQVAGALKASSQFAGFLIYGEDWGLVRERTMMAVRGVLGAEADPFRLATLTREEHGRLREEAGSMALGGGRRAIHVQDAGDALSATLERLAVRPADVLIILEAGELQARSKLRGFAEKQPAWGTVACYLGNAGQVSADIRATLGEAGCTVTPAALAFLAEELAGESVTRRSELEKLALYADGDRVIDIDMAQLCCSVSAETSLGAAVSAALAGRVELCDSLVAEMAREGATGPGLLAVLSGQVQRLLKVRLLIDSGQSAEEACRALAPPLYPRQAATFMQDLQRWRAPALEGLARAIRDADIACKRAASPDLAIAGRLLASVAARQAGRG